MIPEPLSRNLRRPLLLTTLIVLVGALLAGCGSSSAPNKSIALYNGQHVQTTDTLVAAFERESGIKVNVRSDDEDTFADEIVTEGPNSPADVIYTENSPHSSTSKARACLLQSIQRRSLEHRASSTRHRETGSGSPHGSACLSTTQA